MGFEDIVSVDSALESLSNWHSDPVDVVVVFIVGAGFRVPNPHAPSASGCNRAVLGGMVEVDLQLLGAFYGDHPQSLLSEDLDVAAIHDIDFADDLVNIEGDLFATLKHDALNFAFYCNRCVTASEKVQNIGMIDLFIT